MKKVLLVTLFIIMLISNKLTKYGTILGLSLWIEKIVPTLFPYILIINIIMLFDAFTTISLFVYPLFYKIFKVSINGCFCIIVGFLCGFPIGTKLINDMVYTNKITINEGNYLLSFCNNISPSFYICFIINENINNNTEYKNTFFTLPTHILLILLPYLVSILCSYIYRLFDNIYITKLCKQDRVSGKNNTNITNKTISDCILDTFDSLFTIGGYIIIFSIISNILFCKLNLSILFNSILKTFLDISNGAILFRNFDLKILITILIPLCSFGGISALFQSLAFFKNDGLSKYKFIKYRIINFFICFIITNLFYYIKIE